MLALLIAAFTCPADQRLAIDLTRWKKQGAPLSALGLGSVPPYCGKPAGVDIFEANLTGERDKLGQVRFRCGGWIALRIAVLVPLPDGAMCKLDGEDLSVSEKACDK